MVPLKPKELTPAHLCTSGAGQGISRVHLKPGKPLQREHPSAERHAATRRMLDHYVHTATAGALVLEPHRGSIALAAAEPGVVPEPMTERGPAAAWFTAEHAVLLASIRHAAEAGYDPHTWQLAWALATFLHWQGHADTDGVRAKLCDLPRTG